MVKLCLMASHGHPPGLGFVFHQEQGMCRVVKDCQPCLPIQRMKQEIIRPSSVSLMPYEEPWTPISSFCESHQIVKFDLTVKRPILIDMQDNVVNSILFSNLVTKQCAKHERILRFLTSGHSEVEKGRLDFPALSELMELQALAFNEHRQLYFPSLIYPSMEVDAAKHLLDVVGHIYSSKMSVQSDGQVPITSSGTKMEDVLSILTEFYLLNTTSKWRKESLVPPFSRLNIVDVQHNKHTSSLKLEAVTATPLKSPGKLKHKPSLRKKNSKKGGTERDLYKTNYFHACESLLSLMISKKWQGKTAILSLKKSGPELPELLNQFSAGIAGTGLAVVFSVMCKLACGKVPLSGSKLLSTGFGFGLLWLSWAVNRLRDTIVYINKNTKKVGLKEEEMMTRVDRSVNEIYFRAATLLAVAVLRFA